MWGHNILHNHSLLGDPATATLLWQSLPKNPEELWITRAQSTEAAYDAEVAFEPACLLPALDLVVQHKAEAFPKLSRLRVQFQPTNWKMEWLDSLASVCGRAEANGIECTIILEYVNKRIIVQRARGWYENVEWNMISRNMEAPKIWITAAAEEDLAQKMRKAKPKAAGVPVVILPL
jgi:hypothetical protein